MSEDKPWYVTLIEDTPIKLVEETLFNICNQANCSQEFVLGTAFCLNNWAKTVDPHRIIYVLAESHNQPMRPEDTKLAVVYVVNDVAINNQAVFKQHTNTFFIRTAAVARFLSHDYRKAYLRVVDILADKDILPDSTRSKVKSIMLKSYTDIRTEASTIFSTCLKTDVEDNYTDHSRYYSGVIFNNNNALAEWLNIRMPYDAIIFSIKEKLIAAGLLKNESAPSIKSINNNTTSIDPNGLDTLWSSLGSEFNLDNSKFSIIKLFFLVQKDTVEQLLSDFNSILKYICKDKSIIKSIIKRFILSIQNQTKIIEYISKRSL